MKYLVLLSTFALSLTLSAQVRVSAGAGLHFDQTPQTMAQLMISYKIENLELGVDTKHLIFHKASFFGASFGYHLKVSDDLGLRFYSGPYWRFVNNTSKQDRFITSSGAVVVLADNRERDEVLLPVGVQVIAGHATVDFSYMKNFTLTVLFNNLFSKE